MADSQTRIFWAALTDLLLYHYLLHPSTLVALPADRLKTETSNGLPLYWTILFLIRESKLISEPTLSRIGLAVSPLLLFLALADRRPTSITRPSIGNFSGVQWPSGPSFPPSPC